MPIVSCHSTPIASPEDVSHATSYFDSQASFATTHSQLDGAAITAEPLLTGITAPTVSYEPITAEPASYKTAVITTSHILLSRGVKDDPSLPNSSCTSPAQRQQEEDAPDNLLDFAVTTVWETTGKKLMTFGVAGAMRVTKETGSGGDGHGSCDDGANMSLHRSSQESSRKASEWLGLVPKTTDRMSTLDLDAEKKLYGKWWPPCEEEPERGSARTQSENGTFMPQEIPPTTMTRPRRDTREDYEIPEVLLGLSQPIPARVVPNLEDRTSNLSYDSLEARRSWPSISDFGSEMDNVLPPRGRSILRTDRVPNPFSRASSRNRQKDATIEVNVRFMEPRLSRSSTFHDDPTEPMAILDDNLLEPLPTGSICASVNDVLSLEDTPAVQYQKRFSETTLELAYTLSPRRSGSGTSISIDPNRKASSAVTSAPTSCKVSHRPSRSTPVEEKQEFLFEPGTPIEEVLSFLPLSPDLYSLRFKEKQPEKTPVALNIPAEIMHNIYLYLGPVDFDATRHVCRLWYINSLEYSLLDTMLRRGGWSSSVQRELAINRSQGKSTRINEEWLMSKHLARECALGPDWRGNGMQLTACEIEAGMLQDHRHTAFKLCSKLDFRSAGMNYGTDDLDTCGMLFTVSSCSKFLMASQGSIVYIYELNRSHRTYRGEDKVEGGALRPFTSIICPRRVLACSMDTSSNRDAIAILMDGRMGLVCAVTGNSNRSGKATHMRDLRKMQEQSNIFPVSRGGSWRNNVSLGTSHSARNPAHHDQRLHVSVMASEERLSTGSGNAFENGTDDELEYHYRPPAQRRTSGYPELVAATYPMPIEASPPTLYALLCSADDPPRSVALCPQRRCVAFGCSSGIELHWVDALTGEDLNRWFPLTAPSDYLYFLPPRAGVDSAKKLRLVSSQGSPAEKATISERFSGRKKHSAFWGVEDIGSTSQGFFSNNGNDPSSGRNTPRTRGTSDHYRAVPLSDGYHLLFTDPASGVLCLGNDAPLGGPTKLLRKLWFSGPAGEGSPIAYAAGSDLRWGVRVVAAYGMGREQSIWFFSVPADVFAEGMGRGENAAGKTTAAGGREAGTARDWLPWWGPTSHQQLDWPAVGLGGGMNMMWPVQVRGQEIGHCSDVADLAIHSGPEIGITIWAFGRQGMTLTWNVEGRGDCSVKQRWVLRDGTVREADEQGDVEMCDADVLFPERYDEENRGQNEDRDQRALRSTASYDGALQTPELLSPVEEPNFDEVFERDADGDVLMADLPTSVSFSHSACEEKSDTEPSLFEQSWRLEGGEQWARKFSAFAENSEDDSYVRTVAGRRGDRDGEFSGVERGRWDEALGSVQEERLSGGEGTTQERRMRGRNVDLVEELTGLARIDIEIR